MKQQKPIHLLIRFSDRLLTNRGTIEEHQKVIEQNGAVWFGKMGQPIGQQAIERLNKQIEEGIPTFLYLVQGNRKKPTAYISDLLSATCSITQKEKVLIPPYYKELDIIRYIKFWAKITNIRGISNDELSKMVVASSVYPLKETLFKSSSGHFFIQEMTHFI